LWQSMLQNAWWRLGIYNCIAWYPFKQILGTTIPSQAVTFSELDLQYYMWQVVLTMCWSLNITQNSSRRTHDLKNWLTFSFEVHEGLSKAWNKGLSVYWPIRSFRRKPHTNGMIILRTTVLITICTNYVYRWWLVSVGGPVSFSSSCWATTGGAFL
jgi:hypothetical protein